jgi:hypothetical protein
MSSTRRGFLGMASALAAFASGFKLLDEASGQETTPSRSTMPAATWAGGAHATIHRKDFVGIQVKPFAWRDEGADQVLDILAQKGAVNTVFAYTYDTDPNRLQANGRRKLPGHGKYGDGGKTRLGGAYFNYDPKYFSDTFLKDFRVPDSERWDVIEAIAPKAASQNMDFFAWDYNNAFPQMMRYVPRYSEIMEVDLDGRRTTNPCFNHPAYRAFQTGKVECYLSQYGELVHGVMWGCESMGPLDNMIGGDFATLGVTCFCPYCLQMAKDRSLSADRARSGYRLLQTLFAAETPRPDDGYFVEFWRVLLAYPEVLGWQDMWMDKYRRMRAELYGTAKGIAPEKPFGFHMMQNGTFSPFYSAAEDYSLTRHYADFVKVATYNNAGGPRMARLADRLCATIFRDTATERFLPVYYDLMGYHESSREEIVTHGLSADYVTRSTKRILADVKGSVQVYPGIDIDVPTDNGEKHTTLQDVTQACKAAIAVGAQGVVLSRDYSEMQLENLAAAGTALREAFQTKASAQG